MADGSKDAQRRKAWGVLAVVCFLVALLNLAVGIVRFGNYESGWFEVVSVGIWIVFAAACLVLNGRITRGRFR